MAIDDRWHRATPASPDQPPCAEHSSDRTPRYPTRDHERGKRWLVRWRDDEGNQPKRSFAKKSEAEAFDLQVRAEASQGLYRDYRAGKENFKSYADQWLEDRDIDLTSRGLWRRQLDNHIYPRFGHVALAKIKPSAVSGWLKQLPGADVTRRSIYDRFRAILDAAVDDDIITKNPARAKSVVPPKIPATDAVAWDAEHVRGLRDLLPDRLAVVVDIMAGAGLRINEALALGKDDVDWLRGTIHVKRQIKRYDEQMYFDLPKNDEVRKIRLAPTVRDRLAAHLATYPAQPVTLPWEAPDDGEPVTVELIVTTKHGTPVHANSLLKTYWWRAVCGRPASPRKAAEPGLGLPHERAYGPHGLRHTFASVLLANGIPISEVQRALGHTTPIVTLRTYTHVIEQIDTPDGERVVRGWSAIDDLLAGTAAVTGAGEPAACAPNVPPLAAVES